MGKAQQKTVDETRSNRPLHFGLGILRAAPLKAGTLCELCKDREACLRCLDQAPGDSQGPVLLCGLCDNSKHLYAHFHRRESFGAGFWQREAASVTFSADGARAEPGENCKLLLVVITLSICSLYPGLSSQVIYCNSTPGVIVFGFQVLSPTLASSQGSKSF